MAARSKVMVVNDGPFDEFAALDEDDESTAEELHALIERERGDFISLEEYAKRRGLRCARPDSNAPGGNKHKLDV